MSGLIVDLFAGGGGASVGIEAALGRPVDLAINHDPLALAVHEANHPATRHLPADIWEVKPREATGGRPVELVWLSPSCTHYSRARGGRPKEEQLRSLPWVARDWADEVRPRVIVTENVSDLLTWGPLDARGTLIAERKGETFEQWVGALRYRGYEVDWRVLDAANYGAPTARQRVFIIARCDGQPIIWPRATHGPGRRPFRTAADCIDWSIPCPSIFTRATPLVEKSLARTAKALVRYVAQAPRPFLVPEGAGVTLTDQRGPVFAWIAKYYGGIVGQDCRAPLATITATGQLALMVARTAPAGETSPHAREVYALVLKYYGTGIGQSLREPLGTITTKDRMALVHVATQGQVIVDVGLRMLKWHELLRAQFGRFAETYDLSAATTKKDQVRLIGNSVCPEVAEAVVRAQFADAAQVAA